MLITYSSRDRELCVPASYVQDRKGVCVCGALRCTHIGSDEDALCVSLINFVSLRIRWRSGGSIAACWNQVS